MQCTAPNQSPPANPGFITAPTPPGGHAFNQQKTAAMCLHRHHLISRSALVSSGTGRREGHQRGSSWAAARSARMGSASWGHGCSSRSCCSTAQLASSGRSRRHLPCPWGSAVAWGPPPPGSSRAAPWGPGWGRRALAGRPSGRPSLRSCPPGEGRLACRSAASLLGGGAPIQQGCARR